jgi:hypothetical protein
VVGIVTGAVRTATADAVVAATCTEAETE